MRNMCPWQEAQEVQQALYGFKASTPNAPSCTGFLYKRNWEGKYVWLTSLVITQCIWHFVEHCLKQQNWVLLQRTQRVQPITSLHTYCCTSLWSPVLTTSSKANRNLHTVSAVNPAVKGRRDHKCPIFPPPPSAIHPLLTSELSPGSLLWFIGRFRMNEKAPLKWLSKATHTSPSRKSPHCCSKEGSPSWTWPILVLELLGINLIFH